MRIFAGLILIAAALVLSTAHTSTSQPPPTYPVPSVGGGTYVVPYYGATYSGAGLSAADGREMASLLREIRDSLLRMERGVEASPKLDVATVAQARCMGCHTPAKSEAKGGGFNLFNDEKGTMKALSAAEKTKVKQAVASGAMPPTTKLSAAEKAAFE